MEQALRHLEDRLKDTLESIPLYDLPEVAGLDPDIAEISV